MTSDWKSTTWGELAILEYGKGLTGYENANGNYPVYGTNGRIGWHTKPLFDKAGVIIGRKGAYRGVHYSKIPFFVIDTAFYLKPKIEIDLRWAYYQLLTQDINNMDSGSAIPSTSRPDFYALRVKLPSLPEQRAIAGILGALDDKIELNRRMNATLESMARAVFRQWFVEGEDVGNYKIGRLADVAKVNERSITKEYPNSEIEYIDISSVATGHLDGTTRYSLADAPSRARRLVKHGDTIWSTVRPNRKSFLFISKPKENLVVSTGFAVLTPTKIPPSFLYFWVTTDEFVDYLVSNADGSAYPAVLSERFAEAEMIMPPKEILDRFENVAGSMLAHIAHNENESRTLASLRDSLLPKLMRGEVRVSAL